MAQRAVFLDRDGTINEELCYLSDPRQIRLIGQAAQAIGQLNRAGYKIIVFTNQAGVGRGYFDEQQLGAVHAALVALLAQSGACLDAVYFCPHHPEFGLGPYRQDCDCRKPKPGMLLRAARELGLDLGQSFAVGDKLIDLAAGHAAGCRTVLVRTGYGRQSEQDLAQLPFTPHAVADDLWQASRHILQTTA